MSEPREYLTCTTLADKLRELVTHHPETADYEVWIEASPSAPLLGYFRVYEYDRTVHLG